MNYRAVYDAIIARASDTRELTCYTERHHIIPQCLGGPDAADNIVVLTAREHFIAHLCLARLHPDTGLVHAAWQMANRMKTTSRIYESLRIAHSNRLRSIKRGPQSDQHKAAISNGLKGKTRSELHSQRISKANLGKPKNYPKGRKSRGPMSEELKAHLRELALAKLAHGRE